MRDLHHLWMQRCLDLARRGAGQVSPNPLVGSVLVDAQGRVLGEGFHERFGGPHAEVNAIRAAEAEHGPEALSTATLYVNLEPCAHFGKTPPCADLIVEKRLAHVVIGMEDPFPKVSGRGIERLREAGIEVTVGVMEKECTRLNEPFTHHLRTGRPFVALKIAQTLDARVATLRGDSRWVTGLAARTRVHQWRAELDAVLVGTGTALCDDPALTVRHAEGRQPVRVVLDRAGALSPSLQLFSDMHAARTVAVIGEAAQPAYEKGLTDRGGRVLRVKEREGHLDLVHLLDLLGQRGGPGGIPLQSLLVEAGPRLSSALLQEQLVDRLYLFIAPKILGDGIASLMLPPPLEMAHARTFAESSWEMIGEDVLFSGFSALPT